MYQLNAFFSADRGQVGTLSVNNQITGVVEFGPIPCLGLGRHRVQGSIYGDTPIGNYQIVGKKPADNGGVKFEQFGPNPRLRLKGINGVALDRENVAAGNDALLRIHGGRQSSVGVRKLKSTDGCIRVLDHDMRDLLLFLETRGITYPLQLKVIEAAYQPIVDVLVDVSVPPKQQDSP